MIFTASSSQSHLPVPNPTLRLLFLSTLQSQCVMPKHSWTCVLPPKHGPFMGAITLEKTDAFSSPATSNYHSLQGQGRDCVANFSLCAGFVSDLGLHKFSVRCELACAALVVSRWCFLEAIHRLWLLYSFYPHLLQGLKSLGREGVVYVFPLKRSILLFLTLFLQLWVSMLITISCKEKLFSDDGRKMCSSMGTMKHH